MILNFMSTNPLGRASHPPRSPNLASYDFSLFGNVKESLTGKEFADRELLEAVNRIVEDIERMTLYQVFLV
jgi:hypothetical protein